MAKSLLADRIDVLILEHINKIRELQKAKKTLISICEHKFNLKDENDNDKCSKCGHTKQ